MRRHQSLPDRTPPFVQGEDTACLFIIQFISAGGYGALYERELNKRAPLSEPDSGLICRRSVDLRGCNALTYTDCRSVEGEERVTLNANSPL